METKVVKTKYGEIEVIKGDHIGEVLSGKDYYEDEFINICLMNVPTKRRTAIDIGANIGTWSIPLAQNFKQVYSFEPQPEVFQILKKNVSRFSNITCKKMALGNFNGTSCMRIGDTPNNYGSTGLSNSGDQVIINKLDNFRLNDIDFMKIDVEGAEKMVIFGAQETIKRCRPVIFFEHTGIKHMEEKLHIYESEIKEWSVFEWLHCVMDYTKIKKFKSNYLAIP